MGKSNAVCNSMICSIRVCFSRIASSSSSAWSGCALALAFGGGSSCSSSDWGIGADMSMPKAINSPPQSPMSESGTGEREPADLLGGFSFSFSFFQPFT